MDGPGRNRIFQSLKPHCVHLNQVVLQFSAHRETEQAVIAALRRLLEALEPVTRQLNRNLAEYVFFPLSHVLKEARRLGTEALELALHALNSLLLEGWRSDIPSELGTQLFVLLTFFAQGKATDGSPLSSAEDLQNVAFDCLTGVLNSLGSSHEGQTAITATKMVPAVGNSVTVMLQGVVDGPTSEIQLSSLAALEAFCACVPDKFNILSGFLPGIVSSLTKVLTPSTKNRRVYKVISKSLKLLTTVLDVVVSDEATRHISSQDSNTTAPFDSMRLQEASAQLKIALSNVMRLRQHNRIEVKEALSRLCLQIIKRSPKTLLECQSMAVDTLLFLGTDDDGAIRDSLFETMLVSPSFTDSLKFRLHSCVVALPRLMQGQDDIAKKSMIRQISLSFQVLGGQQAALEVVNGVLATSLRDSLANAMRDSPKAASVVASSSTNVSTDIAIMGSTHHATNFNPILLGRRSQQDTVNEVANLVEKIGSAPGAVSVLRDLVQSMRNSNGDQQVAGLWLSLRFLQSSDEKQGLDVSDLLNFIPDTHSTSPLIDELYSFSLSLLSDSSPDNDVDWRLQALALEAVSFQASRQGKDFEAELVEALYPIVHLMGSPLEELRLHAMTCLNMVAKSCGVHSAKDLLVGNVDYLVNSVAIKLNTFDISPQAPQVLLMMIKLCGTDLLPYLDDLVESIFGALDLYHGYPKLVELLFSTLMGVVEEGSKTPQLLIEDGESQNIDCPANHEQILDLVRKSKALYDEDSLEPLENLQQPGSQNSGLPTEEAENPATELADIDDQSQPPAKNTYNLLLKITRMSQHFLPSASPNLRTSLLMLLKTAFPPLAKHQDSFLPLINTLWPVLFPRLSDPEPYIVAHALEVMALACAHAGNFMRGRIEGVWEEICRIHRDQTGVKHVVKSASLLNSTAKEDNSRSLLYATDRSMDAGGYLDAPSRMIWSSLVVFLCSVAEHVDVDEEIYDQIINILLPILQKRPNVCRSCQKRNPDAVWIALLKLQSRSRNVQPVEIPHTVSYRAPRRSTKWNFAPIVV